MRPLVGRIAGGWMLAAIALTSLLAGVPAWAFVVAVAGLVVVLWRPSHAHQDARRRSRPPVTWQARPAGRWRL